MSDDKRSLVTDVPADLLEQVNKAAKAQLISRAAFVRRAVKDAVESCQPVAAQ
jgi:metal-responsive CopG/Arc/MetJ family transcriptional regulator